VVHILYAFFPKLGPFEACCGVELPAPPQLMLLAVPELWLLAASDNGSLENKYSLIEIHHLAK
jgi:hypothetical protein